MPLSPSPPHGATVPQASKEALARHALAHHVRAEQTLGLGSGTTAETFIRALAADKSKRPRLCIASSVASHRLAAELGLPIVAPASLPPTEAHPALALSIDGTDALDRRLRLVKGGGGCLLREKILAQNSCAMLVLAEESKLVPHLGHFPLPVEIDPFAWQLTARAVASLFERTLGRNGNVSLRGGEASPALSDGGHYTLDCDWGEWEEETADLLASSLKGLAGVLEHGLFVSEASLCLLARAQENSQENSHGELIVIRELSRST